MRLREFGELLLITVAITGILPVLAGATAVVSISNVSIGVGESITVPIMINGATNIKGANILLSYNSSIVLVTNIGNSAFGLETFKSINNVSGTTRYAVLSLTPLSGDVKFADVTLKAVANAGSSPLNLSVISLQNGTSEVPRTAQNGTFTIRDLTPPASISNLQNTTGNFWINWSWNNPPDPDFSHTTVFINGGFITNTSLNYYNSTLSPHTTREIATRTVDTSGNINAAWVNQTTQVANNIPVLTPIGNKVINENQLLTIALSASDADGDVLAYSTNRTDLFSDFNTATGRGNWTPSFIQAGIYYVNFGVSDGFGGIGSETIQITVNNVNVPPIVANPSANPSEILLEEPGNADYAHISTRLNVTVIDTNGVGVASVTINLSSINGSSAAVMTPAGGNVYSIITNATVTSGSKSLRVNATDALGNSNTSVNISLNVLRNGDVNGDGNVNLDDAIYLANHVLQVPGYETISTLASDVDGNGIVNLDDAIYLANHALQVPGYELLS